MTAPELKSILGRLNRFRKRAPREIRRLRRRLTIVSRRDIDEALSHCRLQDGPVLVHSSLSACGHIEGGVPAVIEALREWAGHRILAMPTHTYYYPDEQGEPRLFDAYESPSVTGTVTEEFRRQKEVVRSIHPSHSIACCGNGSIELIRGHENCQTPCGPGTPYRRLIDRNASVLMFGCSMDAYTLFHTAEHDAGVPYLYWKDIFNLKIRATDGSIRTINVHRQDMRVSRRFADTDQWAENHGLLRRVPLGRAELLFIPSARQMHEALVERLRSDQYFLVAAETASELRDREALLAQQPSMYARQ